MIKRVHTSKDGNVQIGRQEPSSGEIASCKDIEAWKETSVPASTSFRLLEHTRKQDNHHNHKQRRPRHIRLHEIPTRQSCINSLASNAYTMTQLVYVNVLRLSNPCSKPVRRRSPQQRNRNRAAIPLRPRLRTRRRRRAPAHNQRRGMHFRHKQRFGVYLHCLADSVRPQPRRPRAPTLPEMQPVRHAVSGRGYVLHLDAAGVYGPGE